MIRFTEYSLLIEGKKVTVPALKNLIGKEKVFVLFGGTMGAGKTYWANKNLKGLIPILDPDEMAVEMAGTEDPAEVLKHSSKALNLKKAKTKEFLKQGKSFVDMGTMANENAAKNKLIAAKDAGFTTVCIFISTDPETAIKRNRERIAKGGRGVMPEKEGKIAAQFERATQAFKSVKRHADYFMEIKS